MRLPMRHLGAAVVIAACILMGRALWAQSLSDLDWEGFEQQSVGLRIQPHTDPFARGVVTADELTVEELQLTGVAYSDRTDKAYALISGYLVRPGDRIAGYRVDKIEKNRVRLRRLDEVVILSLGGGM
jgi:hypothetical protein